MKKLLSNKIFISFVCAIMFGVVYLILNLIFKGNVDFGATLMSMASYFIVSCFFYFIAPKLRGDKDNSK